MFKGVHVYVVNVGKKVCFLDYKIVDIPVFCQIITIFQSHKKLWLIYRFLESS